MIEQFKAAKKAAVPILAIESFDPQQTIRNVAKAANGNTPLLSWDLVKGLNPLNQEAVPIATDINAGEDPQIATGNPTEMLSKITRLPANVLVFMHNAPRYFSEAGVIQGIWNLRDVFKAKGTMLILLGTTFMLPDELKQDVMVISEPLPDYAEIETIIKSITADAGMKEVEEMDKVGDTLVGLSAFAAEQTLATCIEKVKGKVSINRKALWERKCKAIEQSDGLSVYRGKESFSDIGGYDNVKDYILGILKGRSPARSIVFVDEIEKQFAGIAGDNTGVSQDQLGALLTFMQDNEIMGMIFIGPPGCTKSMLAKAAGNEAEVPTVIFDIGAMKDSKVGESGRKIRQNLKIIQAISQGKAMFIATCNSIAILPPELRRRFTLGTFFFDLPTQEERAIIWDLYFKKYEIPEEQRDKVDDSDWTGAEIKNCCHIAWMRNCKISEAAGFVVPVAKSAFDQISALRKQASGKYISAGTPGFYQFKMTSELHDMYRAIDVSEKEVKQ